MNPINILVIDDEKETTENLMRMLKRKDKSNKIGEILVENSMLKNITSLEQYDLLGSNIIYDVILIDYQLNRGFTGAMVSAWMLIQQIKAPRISLTGAKYPGPSEYFDENILKNEITSNPLSVIDKIVSCVENFNYEKWLENQYVQLINEYTKLLDDEQNGKLTNHEKLNLKSLEQLLDKFENIIDNKQNEMIKFKYRTLELKSDFMNKNSKFLSEIEVKEKEMEKLLEELKGYRNE